VVEETKNFFFYSKSETSILFSTTGFFSILNGEIIQLSNLFISIQPTTSFAKVLLLLSPFSKVEEWELAHQVYPPDFSSIVVVGTLCKEENWDNFGV